MLHERGALLTVLGIGVGLMYLFDPERGRRRRALWRDRVAHSARVGAEATSAASRDLAHRATGLAARVRGSRRAEPVDDTKVARRVRSQLGRCVSHPRAIDVDVHDGRVVLSGPILEDEVNSLLSAIERVPGVDAVINALDVYSEPGNVPALQGGRELAGERRRGGEADWSPSTRVLVGTAGAALVGFGAARRRTSGAFLMAAGAGLLARAATNLDLRRLSGIGAGRQAVVVEKTITIEAPVNEVYQFWTAYRNFPHFMSRVLEVRPGAHHGRSHWVVVGPAGVPVEFDAEVTVQRLNDAFGWQTLEGQAVAHAGLIQFEATGDGRTRVHVHMSYNPPGGAIGHGVAAAFGVDPKSSLDADLARLKTLIETGQPPRDAAQPLH